MWCKIDGAAIVDPKKFTNIDKYIDELVELRKVEIFQRRSYKFNVKMNQDFLVVLMVRLGDADGLV